MGGAPLPNGGRYSGFEGWKQIVTVANSKNRMGTLARPYYVPRNRPSNRQGAQEARWRDTSPSRIRSAAIPRRRRAGDSRRDSASASRARRPAGPASSRSSERSTAAAATAHGRPERGSSQPPAEDNAAAADSR